MRPRVRLRTRVSRHLRRGEKMRHFTIIGAGLGTPEGLTGEAKAALLSAGRVFGTRRLAAQLSGLRVIETCAFTDLAERAREADAERVALLVSGEKTLEAAAEKIRALGCRFVLISCGERGCYYSYRGGKGMVPSYLVEAVDTTGAGDCFFAAFLYLLRSVGDMETVPEERMISMLRFANAAGALTTTCRGGAAGAPSAAEIEKCMRENPIRDI